MCKHFSSWHLLFALFLTLQLTFWAQARTHRPNLEIVSEPPQASYLKALAMGDDQLIFRSTAFRIQNMGDTWGRFTSLKQYDLGKLSRWFASMDTLDTRSNMLPSMAAYYFSQTQDQSQVHFMASYLYDHAVRDVSKKWWWLLQGMYLANHKMNDKALALKMAQHLLNPDVSVWAQQMLAVAYEKQGEFEDAYRIMQTIAKNSEDIPERDLKYMSYFVEERLTRLDARTKNRIKKETVQKESTTHE